MPVASQSTLPRIVVVGGGAGGLELVTRLGDQLGRRHKAVVALLGLTGVWSHAYSSLRIYVVLAQAGTHTEYAHDIHAQHGSPPARG